MKDLPDFPRYTGVHPTPPPVRREEPDWEVYTTKTVSERRAASIRHDAVASWLESPVAVMPIEKATHLHQDARPPEWNFGIGPATGFVSKAQVAAFYGRDFTTGTVPERFNVGARVTHSVPGSFDVTVTVDHVYDTGSFSGLDDNGRRWTISDRELGNCHIAGSRFDMTVATPNITPAQAVAVINEKLAGYAKTGLIVADEPTTSPWPNSMDALREAAGAFEAGEIAGYEVTVREGKTESVTTTPWPGDIAYQGPAPTVRAGVLLLSRPTPGDSVAVVGDRDRSKDPPLKFVFIEGLRQ